MNTWRLQLFSGFRLREPSGSEVTTKSRRLIDLLTILALQNDSSYSRHSLAKQIFWDVEEGHDARMTVLLSRATQKFSSYGKSFLRITGDTVRLDRSLIEVDLQDVVQLIEEISDEATKGRPIKRLFEILGNVVSPFELSPGSPFVDEALRAQKHRLRYLIQGKLVPAVGVQFASSIGALIDILGLEDPKSSSCCSQLMLIYAGIGDTGAINRVFARHEDTLDEEFGSVVSSKTHEIYDLALSTEPFEGRSFSLHSIPFIPTNTFGLEPLIQKLGSLARCARKGDLIELIGSRGSGKTHALSLLYDHLRQDHSVLFVDLNQIDHETIFDDIYETGSVIFFDNYSPKHQATVSTYIEATSVAVAFLTTLSPSGLPGSVKYFVPPLEAGTSLDFGPAIELILSQLNANECPNDIGTQFRLCNELVTLTAGNPGALLNALDIINTLGFKAGIEYIHSDLVSFGPVTLAQSESSFRRAILERVELLSPIHLHCCQILTRLRHPISIRALVATGSLSPGVIREINELGFIKIHSDHHVELFEPVRCVLESTHMGSLLPETWEQFSDSLSLWIQRQSEDVSNHLDLSSSLRSLEIICKSLLERDDVHEGLSMFEALSKWFPSTEFSLDLVLQAEARLLSFEEIDSAEWVKFVVAVGKGLFHKGHYRRMLSLCHWATNYSSYEMLDEEGRYRLQNLFGLAFRSNEKLIEAESCYLEALQFAPTCEAKVTLNFNLGCLAEGSGRKFEALKFFEMAAREYTSKADRRLMTKNTLDIFRLRTELNLNEGRVENSLHALLQESHLYNDRQSQATLLAEIGEAKFKDNHFGSAGHYMAIGVFLCCQLGLTKDTVRLCKPTLNELIACLHKSKLASVATQLEVLTLSLNNESNLSGELAEALHLVLNEILMQGIHKLVEAGNELPGELRPFFAECDRVQAQYQYTVPLTSILESLSLKLNSSQIEVTSDKTPNPLINLRIGEASDC